MSLRRDNLFFFMSPNSSFENFVQSTPSSIHRGGSAQGPTLLKHFRPEAKACAYVNQMYASSWKKWPESFIRVPLWCFFPRPFTSFPSWIIEEVQGIHGFYWQVDLMRSLPGLWTTKFSSTALKKDRTDDIGRSTNGYMLSETFDETGGLP